MDPELPRDPIAAARHDASRTRGMIIATSLVAAAFAAAWYRHHVHEAARQQAELDRLHQMIDHPVALQLDRVTNAGDDPIEAARLMCRHVVDCSNAPADERSDRVASCTLERRAADSAAANAACLAVPCDQLSACLASRAAPR